MARLSYIRAGGRARGGAVRTLERVSPESILLLTVLTVGATLRFANLGAQSYWTDEAQTVQEMHLSLGALLHQVRINETTPPLYFLVAWLWSKLFGTGEPGLRSLSAMCGTALIPVTYLCARELLSRRAGVLAAAMAAVNPFLIWYSQEARAYAMFALLASLSLLFCLRAYSRPSRGNLALWGLASGLTLLTHFFAGFLIAAEGLLLLFRFRTRIVLVACGTVAIVQLALLPLAVGDTSQSLSWITSTPLAVRLQQIPAEFGFGALYRSSLLSYGLAGAGAVAVVVLLLTWVTSKPDQNAIAIAAGLAGAAIVVPIVLALLGRDYVVPRNLIACWVPLGIALAGACSVRRARVAGGALAVVLLASFLWAQVRVSDDPQYQRPDWRAVAQALGRSSAARAIVPYDGEFATLPLEIYMPHVSSAPPSLPVRISEVDVIGSSWQSTASPLPPGVRLLSSRSVGDLLVERFSVQGGWGVAPAALAQRARTLVGPAPTGTSVLIQAGI